MDSKKKYPKGPRLRVSVTPEHIATAIPANSGHCMIADAIKAAFPEAAYVAVDIATCRFTDPKKGYRYVYLTPRTAQEALIDFDEGAAPAPFDFELKNAHVTRAGNPKKVVRAAPLDIPLASESVAEPVGEHVPDPAGAEVVKTVKKRQRSSGLVADEGGGSIPRRVGGKRPPQLHIRREFGLRAFRAASSNRPVPQEPAPPAAEGQIDA